MSSHFYAGIVLAQGAIFGVLAYVMFRKSSAKLARCQRTWGHVIEVKEHSGFRNERTKHPVIRYKTATGEDVTFESKYGSSDWKVKTGDRLEILVSQSNPSDAEVVSFMAQFRFALLFGIASIGSVICATVVYLLF